MLQAIFFLGDKHFLARFKQMILGVDEWLLELVGPKTSKTKGETSKTWKMFSDVKYWVDNLTSSF